MEKIPAAEEFLYRKLMLSNQPYLKGSQYVQAMIEFAKLHVEAYKQEIKENIPLGHGIDINYLKDLKSIILNTYPLTNIK